MFAAKHREKRGQKGAFGSGCFVSLWRGCTCAGCCREALPLCMGREITSGACVCWESPSQTHKLRFRHKARGSRGAGAVLRTDWQCHGWGGITRAAAAVCMEGAQALQGCEPETTTEPHCPRPVLVWARVCFVPPLLLMGTPHWSPAMSYGEVLLSFPPAAPACFVPGTTQGTISFPWGLLGTRSAFASLEQRELECEERRMCQVRALGAASP